MRGSKFFNRIKKQATEFEEGYQALIYYNNMTIDKALKEIMFIPRQPYYHQSNYTSTNCEPTFYPSHDTTFLDTGTTSDYEWILVEAEPTSGSTYITHTSTTDNEKYYIP